MKNFIWISLLLFIILGCGSRTSQLSKESEKLNMQSSGSQSTEMKNETKSESITTSKLVDLGFGFSINPINGKNSFFNFISGKDTLSLQTNAKVDFYKNNKTKEEKVIVVNKTVTTYKSQTTYKTQTKYQTIKKIKQTERKAYPWYLFVILGIFLTIGFIFLWKWFKTTNLYTYLPFIKWKQK